MERRPRPGPVARIALLGAAGAGSGVAFALLLAFSLERVAAVVLVALPVLGFVIWRVPAGGYLDRHIGAQPASHALVGLWAIGVAAIGAGAPVVPRVAAGIAAVSIGAVVIGAVVWARHPAELAAHGFDEDQPPRRDLAASTGVLSTLVGLGEAAVSSLIAVAAPTGAVTVAIVATACVYAAWVSIVLRSAYARVRVGDDHLRPVIAASVAAHGPEILVHFSGALRTLYQLEQWMPPLVAAGRRVLLVVREEETFREVAGRWPVPVVFIGDFPDLDLVVTPSTRLAMYVNTGTKNNQLVRFGSITHVQLHHGDSDKPPSSSKPMRLYDHHVVAGSAAYERLLGAGIVSSPDAVSIVGRPQTDGLVQGPLDHGGRTVLYAPTWEGYHLDSALSSIAVAGYELVRIAPADIDLVVRPHPLTGSVDRRLAGVVSSIRDALSVRRGRFVDPGRESLGDSLNAADVLIADVSSVLVDFLAVDRPAIVIDVEGIGEDALHERYPSTSWSAVIGPDLAGLDGALADAFGADARCGARAEARSRLLAHIGSAGGRFAEVIGELLARSAEPAQSELVEP
jgi:CDP-Glycerol:Poly(glycerophosphate) glycerophosphotransferase